MQCTAVSVRTRKRCRLPALAGYRYCRHHRNALRPQEQWMPAEGDAVQPDQEVPAIPDALVERQGVSDEIGLLRHQIRQSYQAGDAEAVRRGIDTLCKALRIQHVLEGRSGEGISSSIAHVLDEIGAELGMPL
jgi:hypothetical protein